MKITRIQSVFSRGAIDPRLRARIDWEGYYKGAQLLNNVIVLPQGGCTKRFGTSFVAEVTGVPSDADIRITLFEVGAQNYFLVVFIPLNILIYQNGALIATVSSPYQSGDIQDLRWAQDSSTLTIVHANYAPRILYYSTLLPPTWLLTTISFKNYPVYDFLQNYASTTFTFSGPPDVTYYGRTITVTASASCFTSAHVGGIIVASSMVLRITAYTSNTQVSARVIVAPLQALGSATGSDMYIATPAWSDTNGWPASVTFFQNRLVFGGTAALPESLFLSRIGNFVDFNEWDGTASAAITIFVKGDKAHDILYVKGAQSLLVFTVNGQYSTPLLLDSAITGERIALNQQTKNSILEVEPQLIDSQIIFVDRGGKIVRSLSYNIQAGSFYARNISVLSSHIINSPVDSTTYNNANFNDGELLLLVNSDGSLVIYQSMQDENISAWTPHYTQQGTFLRCSAINEVGYFVTKRYIGGRTRYYIESIEPEFYTDCTRTVALNSPGKTITGLDVLEGLTVQVLGDGFYIGDFQVIAGEITVPTAASNFNIGIGISIDIQPMPINADLPYGPTLYQPKHINTIWLDFYQTLNVFVDGVQVPFLQYTELGQPPTPQDGVHKVTPALGWEYDTSFHITHNAPYPFTLRGIGISVDINYG